MTARGYERKALLSMVDELRMYVGAEDVETSLDVCEKLMNALNRYAEDWEDELTEEGGIG